MSCGQVRIWKDKIQKITKRLKYKTRPSASDPKHLCSEYKSRALPLHEPVGCIIYKAQ
jgi:hypothetical protein